MYYLLSEINSVFIKWIRYIWKIHLILLGRFLPAVEAYFEKSSKMLPGYPQSNTPDITNRFNIHTERALPTTSVTTETPAADSVGGSAVSSWGSWAASGRAPPPRSGSASPSSPQYCSGPTDCWAGKRFWSCWRSPPVWRWPPPCWGRCRTLSPCRRTRTAGCGSAPAGSLQKYFVHKLGLNFSTSHLFLQMGTINVS